MPKDDRPVVYSTEYDDQPVCQKCKQYPCVCRKEVSLPPSQQTAHVRRETKGRGGKSVVVISNLTLNSVDRKQLATQLKKVCNSGGTTKAGTIEIQGEHLNKIIETLKKNGFKVKQIGG